MCSVLCYFSINWSDLPDYQMEEEDTKEWGKITSDLPDFDGIDPMGWLDRVEKFFNKHGINSEQRVGMAFFSMKGPTDY